MYLAAKKIVCGLHPPPRCWQGLKCLFVIVVGMDVAIGGGGDGVMLPPRGSKFWGLSPKKWRILNENFLNISPKFYVFQYSQSKVCEIRAEFEIYG